MTISEVEYFQFGSRIFVVMQRWGKVDIERQGWGGK